MASDADAAGDGAWKWAIRRRVWDALEADGVARDPRPVHHRIPNFDGAAAAADSVNSDSPQKPVRFLTLSGHKKLLTPQPRLTTEFFSILDSQMIPTGCIPEASTPVGAAKYGRPIGLDEKIKVDLIVIGSVAVDPNSGARLGKGEGFAELEYGMLRYMDAIDDSTVIVTTGDGNHASFGAFWNVTMRASGERARRPAKRCHRSSSPPRRRYRFASWRAPPAAHASPWRPPRPGAPPPPPRPRRRSTRLPSRAERLRLDAAARDAMASAAATAAEADPRAWKWAIRKRVWDTLEAEGVARDPRPVHHRIPNFDGAPAAADAVSALALLPPHSLGRLEVFQNSQCVKVNPDSPQKQVRFLTLSASQVIELAFSGIRLYRCSFCHPGDKKLLTPQPRLRTGFFSVLDSQMIPIGCIPEACTSVGAAKYGRPIGLDERIKVDFIVIGSVVVDPSTGARLGKGEGFEELEYGMLRYMGAIDGSTMIVTTVHDKQLVDDIPVEKLLIHDVPVDIICTPTQVIFTKTKIPKPQGIYWEKLSPEKLGQIRILRELKKRIEQETGTILPSGPSEKLPPTAQRTRRRRRR
ncbi:hypothetical protein HU200_019732 [Digitaria exilis]|uniref:5-formyltetrahydrofolate cyclo-ligase n=1 Tax=Digitaria exilis TaxID=1010633 RepID=A0A835KDZ9_9POAL|nr:hypothetical protein HU200_019732 [Digitaria exilis]